MIEITDKAKDELRRMLGGYTLEEGRRSDWPRRPYGRERATSELSSTWGATATTLSSTKA